MRRGLLFLGLLALLAVRHDLWLWDDASLLFGLPVTLVYHLGYCFVAAAVMAWMTSGGRLAALDAEADAER